jgi:hypothetical protein
MKIKEIYQYALGALIALGFFAILYVVFIKAMPEANKDLGLLVIGALVAKFGDIVSYFFGSSKGSSDKNDIIANQNKPVG